MENNNTKPIFNHLMVDIETMGTESFSCIISIAALEFDIETGAIGKEFYRNISLQSCVDLGLIINADTVLWWMKQSDEARAILNKECVSINKALVDFSAFCTTDYQIWGNSPRFDLGILQNAFSMANMPICWDFKKERDVRTLVSFNQNIKQNHKYEGIAHNALSDCYNQVRYCSKTWASIKRANYWSNWGKLFSNEINLKINHD